MSSMYAWTLTLYQRNIREGHDEIMHQVTYGLRVANIKT
jgi:hypothetical protein